MYFSEIIVFVVTSLLTNIISLAIIVFFLYKYIPKNYIDAINNFLAVDQKKVDVNTLINQINKEDINKIIQQIPLIIDGLNKCEIKENEEEILLRTLDEVRFSSSEIKL